MGANFYIGCHKCKEKAFCLRDHRATGETLTRFARKHLSCGKENPKNVEVVWDYIDQPDWTEEDGYKCVTSEVCEEYARIDAKGRSKEGSDRE